MKPFQLFAALAARQQLKTLQLAKAMGKPKLQPQLHRFLNGEVLNPAATTAQPLATFFKLPLEAVYDEKKATEIAKALGVEALPAREPAPKKAKPARTGEFDADTLKVATSYSKMSATERQRFRLLMLAARDGVNPTEIKPAPGRDQSTPVDLMLGGDSGLTGLDELPPEKTKAKRQ